MNTLSKLKELPISPTDFIVIGSGVLQEKNIRDTQDIDLLVSSQAFKNLKEQGWVVESVNGKEKLSFEIFEAFQDFDGISFEDFKAQTSWIEDIDGYSFNSLSKLRAIKSKWGRDKDIQDIELITNYLEKILKEHYPFVYRWTDGPHTKYEKHVHQGKVSFYLLRGKVTMYFPDKTITLQAGDYIDVPVGVEHSATLGKDGCEYLVGQELEDDT